MIYDHTSSKAVFKWLRKVMNVNKPKSAPARHYKEGDETWGEWIARIKRDQPIGYFVTETLPDFIDTVRGLYKDPLDDIKHYIINRFQSRTHYLSTGLEPGKYHEVDTRILHGLFQTLVDFVEGEKAGDYLGWDKDRDSKYVIKWYHKIPVINWFIEWRCAEAGIDKLKWEMTLATPQVDEWGNDTSCPRQAISAKEQYDLYMWWVNERPARKEPFSVMSDFYARMEAKYPNSIQSVFYEYDEADNQERHELYNKMNDLELQYEQEDEDMMIRLIKIRNGLWT